MIKNQTLLIFNAKIKLIYNVTTFFSNSISQSRRNNTELNNVTIALGETMSCTLYIGT